MKEKFTNFLASLKVPDPLQKHIAEGASYIFEEVMATANALGIQPGVFTPTIHKAAPWIQKETKDNFSKTKSNFILGKIADHHKRKFKGFLEAMKVSEDLQHPIQEAFNSIMEAYSWISSDPSQSYAFGGQGYEMLGASRPMADNIFNMASGTNGISAPEAGPNDMGYAAMGQTAHRDQQDETRNPQPGEEPYKFPTVKLKTNPSTEKQVVSAEQKIPKAGEQNPYAPWWHYQHFFNTQNFS